MSLDSDRLKNAIYLLTRTELNNEFGGFSAGLLPDEVIRLGDAFDRLARAIGYGDGPETVPEITNFAVVMTDVPNVAAGSFTAHGTGTVS